MLLKRVVVTYKTSVITGQGTCSDEFEAAGTDAYLTIYNTDEGQLIVNNCSKNAAGDKTNVDTLAVYNKDVWESWEVVRTETEA